MQVLASGNYLSFYNDEDIRGRGLPNPNKKMFGDEHLEWLENALLATQIPLILELLQQAARCLILLYFNW